MILLYLIPCQGIRDINFFLPFRSYTSGTLYNKFLRLNQVLLISVCIHTLRFQLIWKKNFQNNVFLLFLKNAHRELLVYTGCVPT